MRKIDYYNVNYKSFYTDYNESPLVFMKAEIERLKKENAEMKKRSPGLEFEISEKGQLGIKFGTYVARLYKSQWMKIIDSHAEVKKFIVENNGDLA